MINIYTIYFHRNKTNNKAYVGQTCLNVKNRWQDGRGYKNCTYFRHAIKKYGWDNFEHIIFAEGLTKEKADELETLLIALFDTTNPECGYNLCTGGNSRAGFKMPDEAKKKIRESKIGANNPAAKKCYCIDLQREFSSIKEASSALHVCYSSIRKVCQGKRNFAGGYRFSLC